jgi:hypothetical protein
MSFPGGVDLRRSVGVTRRGLLQAGALGAGLGLSQLLRAEAARLSPDRECSVIILWMRGGPSHIGMWDPNPEAPVEYRGEFGTMATNVPGIQLSDMLPRSVACMDQWSILRSLHHHDAGHSTGDQTNPTKLYRSTHIGTGLNAESVADRTPCRWRFPKL